MKHKVNILAQNVSEDAQSYTLRLNDQLEMLLKNHPNHQGVICFPVSSSDGRITTFIQFTYEEPHDDFMIERLADAIMHKLESGDVNHPSVAEKNKNMIISEITNFLGR